MGDYDRTPLSRNEEILRATIDGTEYKRAPMSAEEELLLELKEKIEEGGGGGGGTTNYNALSNKPKINGVELSGDKSSQDLHIPDPSDTCVLKAGDTMTGGLTTTDMTVGLRQEESTVGQYSTAEGAYTEASGDLSHAEGLFTTASNTASHAEGSYTIASGSYSHAEGSYTQAKGGYTHAEGNYTIANYYQQHVEGRYNDNKAKDAFEIGNGRGENDRSNALEVTWDGDVTAGGVYTDGNGNIVADQNAIAEPYDPINGTYVIGDFVTHNAKLYKCNTPIPTPEPFDSSKWTEDTVMNNTGGGGDIPTKTSDLINDSGFITNLVNNLANYYLKSEVYTQAEVDSLISAIVTLDIRVVSTLPTEDISRTTIYLVPSASAGTSNIKDEYINLDGTSAGWEKIGSTNIDLTGYVTDAELTTALADYVTSAGLTTILADYVTSTDMETALADKADVEDIPSAMTASDLEEVKDAFMPNTGAPLRMMNYSTEEQVVGTWIDGKPLYQKTFVTDDSLEFTANSWLSTSIVIDDGEAIIDAELVDRPPNSMARAQIWGVLNSSTKVVSLLMSRANNYPHGAYVTLRYTKTTD